MTSFYPVVARDDVFVLSDMAGVLSVYPTIHAAEAARVGELRECKPVRFIRETVRDAEILDRLSAAEREVWHLRVALRRAETHQIDDAEKLALMASAVLRAIDGVRRLTGVSESDPMPESSLTLYQHARDHLRDALVNACKAVLADQCSVNNYVDPNITAEKVRRDRSAP